ncbi:MAG: dihydropteroate synthase [Chloroflexi bacterium]|nr:dihydropteroate synthase [Chloroflexota bacterium]
MTGKVILPEWGKRTYIMGIINITPDSFSGDGLLQGEDPVADALKQAQAFVAAGADILDIGAESTRPGAQAVSVEVETSRLVPVIQCLAENLPDTWLSVDTYKSETARAAIEAGADWINDIWGLQADPAIADLAAHTGAPLILMHNRSRPSDVSLQKRLGGRYTNVEYKNLLEDVKDGLMQSVILAMRAGVKTDRIIVDPGIGFGKTREQNLELLNRLNEICALGYPVLLGPSRKSFIGYTLNLPPDQRVEGTAAAIAVGIARGADIIRVHDVEYMVRVARMTDAIVRPLPFHG